MFSRFVVDRVDTVGQIAYALFKADEIDFIERFKEESRREPNDEEMKVFYLSRNSESSMTDYKKLAMGTLQDLINNRTEDIEDEIWQATSDTQLEMVHDTLKDFMDSNKKLPPWREYLRGAIQSTLGAFIFMLLLCTVLFLLDFSDHEYAFRFGGHGQAKIEMLQNTIDSLKHSGAYTIPGTVQEASE